MTTMKYHHMYCFLIIIGLLTGCRMYAPGGNPYTDSPESATTWESTTEMPKTITIIDTRSGEHFFVMEIPVDHKLVIDFVKNAGDNEVLTPDLMMWEVFPSNTKYGPLSNALTVPNQWARRIDVAIRSSGEYANPATDRPLRVDEINDQPDWWTPEGGVIEAVDPIDGYDP
tara:strand:- start:595 stop:1107 length:513 start_codon:yes stop_codon:yes gene_type:complete